MRNQKKRVGLETMTNAKLLAVASKGGRAAHEKGVAPEWTSEEARAAVIKSWKIESRKGPTYRPTSAKAREMACLRWGQSFDKLMKPIRTKKKSFTVTEAAQLLSVHRNMLFKWRLAGLSRGWIRGSRGTNLIPTTELEETRLQVLKYQMERYKPSTPIEKTYLNSKNVVAIENAARFLAKSVDEVRNLVRIGTIRAIRIPDPDGRIFPWMSSVLNYRSRHQTRRRD